MKRNDNSMKNEISFFNKFHIARKTLYFLLILLITLLVVIISDFALSKYIEKEIKNRVELLDGKMASIKVTLLSRTLCIKSLEWASTTAETNLRQHSIRVKTFTAKGINLRELFQNKTISFDKVTIDSGHFQFDRSSKNLYPKTGDFTSPIFKFKEIVLNSIETQVTLDSVVSFSSVLNGKLKEVYVEKSETSAVVYAVKSVEGSISKISMSRHEGMYGLTIANISFNTDTHQITIDSTLVIPNYEKYAFAHRKGRQVGRINLSVPHIAITGIDFTKLADTAWVASKIEIQSFDLYSFKDKRITDLPKKIKTLPMEVFLKLPYSIRVDTLYIRNSNISIEEFPEEGLTSGIITINELNATLTNFNNRIKPGDQPYATAQASALLMNKGQINATFQFPLDGSPTYDAEGAVSNMAFEDLNPVLKSMADVRVESGYLNQLTFKFRYTEFVSKGVLQVDYEDLHILVLDKNRKTTNELKTLLVNTFVKTNINQAKTPVRRSAEINIQRDRSKFIFNVWAKSVLDGLKNSMLGTFRKESNQRKAISRKNKK